MLADISNVDAIYIVCGRTDMRKSIDGLCAIIQEQFSMEIDHALYLFCGRKCDRGTAAGASAGRGAKTGEDTKRAFNLCQYIYFQTGQIKIICFGNYFRGNETNG